MTTRSEIAAVRRASKEVRALSRAERAAAISFCKDARAAVRQSYKDERARHHRLTMGELRAARTTAKGSCGAKLHTARSLRGKADGLLAQWRDLLRDAQLRLGKRPTVARAERRSQSDDAVVREIPPELVPLWNQVKGQIAATSRMSRAEAFLKYAEEHPDDAVASLDDYAEARLAQLMARRPNLPAPQRTRKKNASAGPYRTRADAARALAAFGPRFFVEGVGGVYMISRRPNPAKKRARRKNPSAPSYEASHWGETGKGRQTTLSFPNPDDGPLVELGELVEVVYRTKKGGDARRLDYEHGFSGQRPRLVYNRDGKLLIAGGSYRVEERGIVG